MPTSDALLHSRHDVTRIMAASKENRTRRSCGAGPAALQAAKRASARPCWSLAARAALRRLGAVLRSQRDPM